VPPDPDSLDLLLFRQRQVVSRRQARRHLSEAALRHRLETGRWRVAERGVYLTHSGPVTPEQRLVIGSLAAGAGLPAVLAGLTALIQIGLRGWRSDVVHVLLPWQRRDLNPPPWVVVHRTRRLGRDELHTIGPLPHTLEVRSLVDAAQWAAGPNPTGRPEGCRRPPPIPGRVLRGVSGARGDRWRAAHGRPAVVGGHAPPEPALGGRRLVPLAWGWVWWW
jgi:hypothetical protein